MNIREVMQQENVDMSNIPSPYFLIGLLSAFENRFQAMTDKVMQEISWKQFFAIICIKMCKTPPTINELSEIMGSSHQNVKQILLKLKNKNFVEILTDKKDKRKQRIILTEYCREFCEKNDEQSQTLINNMFSGVPNEKIVNTIETIIQIEDNIKKMELSLKLKYFQ